MLDLNTAEAHIRIDVIDFLSVDDIQCEITVDHNVFRSDGHLQIKSSWFYWSGIQEFYGSLKCLLQGEDIAASVSDMSDEFKLTITRAELGSLVTITYKLQPSRLAFYLELPCEIDIINVALRQIADLIREADVST